MAGKDNWLGISAQDSAQEEGGLERFDWSTPEGIAEALEAYTSLMAMADVVRLDADSRVQAITDAALSEDDKALIAEIKAEADMVAATISDQAAALGDLIKKATITFGETVSGEVYQAVWVRGRGKWDTRGLKRYAKEHPGVLKYYSVGEPSARLRRRQKGKA